MIKKLALIVLVLFIGGFSLVADENTFFDVKGLAPAMIPYTDSISAENLARTRRVVYFFAASWCELCQADMEQLKSRTAEFPVDTTVILVDFDTADELRIRYGIPLQDVFLHIDSQGKKIKLWVGGGLAALKKNIR